MTIRRIKADTASEDGNYIRIERRSRRGAGLFIGAVIGLIIWFLYYGIGMAFPDKEFGLLLIVILSAVVGFFADEGEVIRRVPKIDLVEIKRYSWPARVTVIFDDERIMRGHRGGRKDDEDDKS